MKNLTSLLKWTLRAAVFVALFAFAMNNQQEVTLNLFLGTEWRAPLVLAMLVAFAIGLLMGVLAMVPRWLKQRGAADRARRQLASDSRQFDSTQHAHEP